MTPPMRYHPGYSKRSYVRQQEMNVQEIIRLLGHGTDIDAAAILDEYVVRDYNFVLMTILLRHWTCMISARLDYCMFPLNTSVHQCSIMHT